jgi:hypothetical protein
VSEPLLYYVCLYNATSMPVATELILFVTSLLFLAHSSPLPLPPLSTAPCIVGFVKVLNRSTSHLEIFVAMHDVASQYVQSK